jgi:hypothetical protein
MLQRANRIVSSRSPVGPAAWERAVPPAMSKPPNHDRTDLCDEAFGLDITGAEVETDLISGRPSKPEGKNGGRRAYRAA